MAQLEERVIVVKVPDKPGIRVVALRAILTQAAIMDIFFAMTVDAA